MIEYPNNFSRSELLHSDTAAEKGIDNLPFNSEVEENLIVLANWLQRLRDKLSAAKGRDIPITISSGYRCDELNIAVGGKDDSFHKLGLAADIRAKGISPLELAIFIGENFNDYDQVIEEFQRWVHVGLPQPRRDLLRLFNDNEYCQIKLD